MIGVCLTALPRAEYLPLLETNEANVCVSQRLYGTGTQTHTGARARAVVYVTPKKWPCRNDAVAYVERRRGRHPSRQPASDWQLASVAAAAAIVSR